MHLIADHWFILHPFRQLAAEDGVPRNFQMFVMIDLGNDVRDDLVVYLGGPENRMDDCFVSEDDAVGERRLESTLGRTHGLRASSECIHVFLGLQCVSCEESGSWALLGPARGEGRWDPWKRDEREGILIRKIWRNELFACVCLSG